MGFSGKKKRERKKEIFDAITENFPKLTSDTKLQIPGV